MQRRLYFMINRYVRQNNRRSNWDRFVRFLAGLVVFCTTYALILPAITMEKAPCELQQHIHDQSCYQKMQFRTEWVLDCTYESLGVHVHEQSCYNDAGELICGAADFVVHEHDASCVNEAGELVCRLPEVREHSHTDDCYIAVALDEIVPIYGSAGELQAQADVYLDPAQPSEAEKGQDQPEEATEPEETAESEEATESEETTVPEKTGEPEEATEPALETVELELVCEEPVIELHSHEDAGCYETYLDENGEEQTRLICTRMVVEQHVHGESCFREEQIPVDTESLTCPLPEAHDHGEGCYSKEGNLVCTESTDHFHGDMCYGTWVLACDMQEHTHTEECYPKGKTCPCGAGLHSHNRHCYDEADNLTCQLEEHEETDLCSKDADFREAVLLVIQQIDALPTAAELEAESNGVQSVDGEDDQAQWREEVTQDIIFVYALYSQLSDEEKAYVTNADKLLALEPVWGVQPLAAGVVYPMPDNQTVPVSYVNRRGTTLPLADKWQGYVFTKKYVQNQLAQGDKKYFEKFAVVAEGGDGTYPYYRCYVIKVANDGQLKVVKLFHYDDSSRFSPEKLLTALGEDGEGFFLFTNMRALQKYKPDYYYTQYTVVEPSFRWEKYDNGTNCIQDAEFFGTINLNRKSFTIDKVQSGAVNAKVMLFNYDATINKTDGTDLRRLARAGYLFVQKDQVRAGDNSAPETYDLWEHAKDGIGGKLDSNGKWTGQPGGYNDPTMDSTLDADGYPQALVNGRLATMKLYFDPKGDYHIATMNDGGGLFRQNEKGYWYYDSQLTAASYNEKTKKIDLYNCSLSPSYVLSIYSRRNENELNDINMGNFMPFNKIDADHVRPSQPEIKFAQTFYNASTDNLSRDLSEYYTIKGWNDLWFGMTVDMEFFMPKGGLINGEGMQFHFKGDDDVFVYIGVWNETKKDYDYKLVLDIGGSHAAREGYINFATGRVKDRPATASVTRERTLKDIFGLQGDTFEDYTKLSLKFYYMERGGQISYCKLNFNMPILPDKSLTVTKEMAGDTLPDYVAQAYDFSFRIMKADANGAATDEPFIEEGETFDIMANGAKVGTGRVGADGIFTLKAGQSAVFHNMLRDGTGKYVVQELLYDEISGQYSDVRYTISGSADITAGKITNVLGNHSAFNTQAISNNESEFIIFRNQVDTEKLCSLEVTKALAEGASFDDGREFPIEVTLGGSRLPKGAKYKVGNTTRKADANGIIWLKIGETARLEGLLAGTQYTVRELEGDTYVTSYVGETSGTLDLVESAGEIVGDASDNLVGENAEVTVVNADFLMQSSVNIRKDYNGSTGDANFQFALEQIDANGNRIAVLEGTTVEVTQGTGTGVIYIKYSSGIADGTYYYKIYEKPGTENAIYDDTVYMVQVEVSNAHATITKVNGETYDGVSPLSFVNQKLVDVPVKKTISGNILSSNAVFDFTASITFNGETFRPAESSAYTIHENGTITFSVKANGTVYIRGVPVGAEITVTEAEYDRYFPAFTVGETVTDGRTVIVAVQEQPDAIICNNEGSYLLPATGGAGTTLYTMAGLVLILLSVAYLVYRPKARRREVS